MNALENTFILESTTRSQLCGVDTSGVQKKIETTDDATLQRLMYLVAM
jgi:hypothetical protein